MDIAVLLITFNRLDCLQKVFAKVAEAKPKRLYISSDGWRPHVEGEEAKVKLVREWLLANVKWDCEVFTRFLDTNSGGCQKGVSGAISWMFETEKEGIILEDDCVPSPSFFPFCKTLLEKYRDDSKVFSICGYLPKSHIESKYAYEFASISHCWGWATWANRWQKYSSDMTTISNTDIASLYIHKSAQKYWGSVLDDMKHHKIDSWFFPWNFCVAANKGLTIFPSKNLISNIGDVGVHYDNAHPDSRLNTKVFNLHIDKINPHYNTAKINKVLWNKFYDLQSNFHNKTILSRIFSIKNSVDGKRKKIKILGISINIKNKKTKS